MPTDLTPPSNLEVDPRRHEVSDYLRNSGILVRAKLNGEWGNYDIAELTRQSLFAWLRSRGGSNPWAENTVAIILGHKPEPFWHQQ